MSPRLRALELRGSIPSEYLCLVDCVMDKIVEYRKGGNSTITEFGSENLPS